MIRSNTDCPYCHDIFDQYCNLFKGYKNCDKSDCEVLKILKENEQLKQQIANTCNLSSKDGCLASDRYDIVVAENERLKKQIEKMKCCGNCEHFYCGSEKECPMGHTCMTIDMTPCNEWELVK